MNGKIIEPAATEHILAIAWMPEKQKVELRFAAGEQGEFKTWDFVLGILDMAKQKAEEQKRMGQLAALQQMQAQAARDQAILQKMQSQG